jgi:hypothetical protein
MQLFAAWPCLACRRQVSVAASEKLQANRAKFNKMKAQRNAYKERLAEAVAELAKTRCALGLAPCLQ